jgi:membrane protein
MLSFVKDEAVNLSRLTVKSRRWWSQRSIPTRSLPHYLWRAITNYTGSSAGSRQAAALSYYAIFSIFPLTLFLAVAIGNLVGQEAAQEQIARGLTIFLPGSTVSAMQQTLTDALDQSPSFSLVALAALLWSATGLFSNITVALDSIFGVELPRSMFRQRLIAVLMGLTLVILVVGSFLTSGVLRLVSALSPGTPNVWITIATFFLPAGLDVVIFALLFHYVPGREVHWDAVWPAAIFGAVGWEVAKRAFEWYLTNLANYMIIYGSIATGIVLLFWAWVIASIFLFSAELCARINEWLIEEDERQAQLTRHPIAVIVQDEPRIQDDVLPPPPPPILESPRRY